MKCIVYDFRRAITGRWFLAALFATVAALYMSIGSESFQLVSMLRDYDLYDDGLALDGASLLAQALKGDFGVMTLPALSALPFAAQALSELKCGAIRPVVFRVGRRSWVAGKLLATLVSGMLLQACAALGLLVVLHGMTLLCTGQWFPVESLESVWPLLVRRMLCGGLWAGVGCLVAIMTETSSAAYLAPLCLCYAMVMLGTRFFPDTAVLNPVNWLTGPVWPLLLGLIVVAATLAWLLRRKVNAYV